MQHLNSFTGSLPGDGRSENRPAVVPAPTDARIALARMHRARRRCLSGLVLLGFALGGCAPAVSPPAASVTVASEATESTGREKTASGNPAVLEPANEVLTASDSVAPATPAEESSALQSGDAGSVQAKPAQGMHLVILDDAPADRPALLAAYVAAIRDMRFPYGDVGAVLEALAVKGMERLYPAPAHQVVSGIEYFDASGRTLGELDVVVFLVASGDAVMVSEVKLSANLERAGRKADSQIRRFQNAIANHQVARLHHRRTDVAYAPEKFENVLRFGKIGNQGSLAADFDWEIDLTRDEGDWLQQQLLRAPETAVK